MEFLVISYGIFALTTTILVFITMFVPIVKKLYTMEPVPKIVTGGNKFLIYSALIIFTLLVAPIMFVVWIFPDYSSRFSEALLADLKKT